MSEGDFKKYETSYRQYYGSNYNKALRNLKNTKKRLQRQFVQQYPNAHLDRFKFNVILSTSQATLPERAYRLKFARDNF